VRKRPRIDIDQTGTVCVTRASATLVLSYALAVECGGGFHVAPTLMIVAILGGTAVYVAREDHPFISVREILGVVLCEVFFAVIYVPVLALAVVFPLLFGPPSAYETAAVEQRSLRHNVDTTNLHDEQQFLASARRGGSPL
jgi:hypothetical protein